MIYPSQIRYQEKNPTVSFRLPKEIKEQLKEIAKKQGVSLSDWLKNFFNKKLNDELEKEKLKQKIKELEEENKIMWFATPCSKCGKLMIFREDQYTWKEKIYPILLNAFKNYVHWKCP